MRSRTARTPKPCSPVLPQEDPIELDQRINQWISDLNPRNDAERELVIEAAELAWTIDRTKRSETARLAERVRQAMLKAEAQRHERSRRAGPQAPVQHRGKTLAHARTALGRQPGRVPRRGWKSSAEGCRWLLDHWIGAARAAGPRFRPGPTATCFA